MEAVAKYDFVASQADELSFKRGSSLYVTSKEDDGDWYKAISPSGNQSGFIPAAYIDMEPHEWYIERSGRSHAEKLLLTRSPSGYYSYNNGAFIIRKSESDTNGFALSVRCDTTVQHFRILKDTKNKLYIWPKSSFTSLNQLVQNYKTESISGDPGKDIFLTDMNLESCQALYDFTPANEEELQLRKGDTITVITKDDPNWWQGEVDGRKGYFPTNYVKMM